jgi:L-lactate utilization protein LutB
MLCDSLENRGASSSGIPDVKVYPYAQKYRDMLQTIREKKISKYHLDEFLNKTYDEVMSLTTQPHRVKDILDAIRSYFYKEFMK